MIPNFRKKQNKKDGKMVIWKIGALLVFIFLVFMVFTNYKIYVKRKKLAVQVNNLETKIEGLQIKNESLQEGILKSNDDQYIEKIAREELDLQQPGERVVSFVTKSTQEEESVEQKKILPAWLGWLTGFFRK